MKRLFLGLGRIGCEIVRKKAETEALRDDYFFFFNNEIHLVKEYSDVFEKNNILHNKTFIFNLANNLNTVINSFDKQQIRGYFNDETYSMIGKIANGYDYGAANYRIFSRMEFEYFAQKEHLRKAIQSIVNINDEISIVIVSSLCGSFGSSIVLSLAAKLKSLIMDIGVQDSFIDINVVGITAKVYNSIFPDAIIQYAKANTYATVKEIDSGVAKPSVFNGLTIEV